METIAFQGERGSFSHEVAQSVFGSDIEVVPCREFRDVGAALKHGSARYAVLPVENSIAGSVLPAYDVLAHTRARVIGEVTQLIRHFVLGVPGATLEVVRRVHSHPVALAQCSRFFEQQPNLEAVAVYDTAGAAQEVARLGDPSVAAIASATAGQLYGLDVLQADVQDRNDNQTRFYLLAMTAEAQHGERMKTALLLETDNRPGALVAVLQPFAEAGVNLSKLESRPGETPWTYRFFLEFEGDLAAEAQSALARVQSRVTHLHVLGSFPVFPPAG